MPKIASTDTVTRAELIAFLRPRHHADIVPSSPMARSVRSWGTVCPTNTTVSVNMTAAPRPCIVRAVINSGSAGDAPHNSDATVKFIGQAISRAG